MRKTLPLIAALLAGVVIAIAAVALLGGDDGGDDKKAAAPKSTAAPIPASLREGEELVGPNGAFKMRYPKSWEVVNPSDLGIKGGNSLAAVRQSDGDAFLVVQEQPGKLADSRRKIADDLTARLKKDIKDFQFVRADEVKLHSGNALSYTFLRARSGQVQNLVVIPQGKTTYTLNSIVSGKADQAAKEVSDMVLAFDPEKK
jgi:hypothetical protein